MAYGHSLGHPLEVEHIAPRCQTQMQHGGGLMLLIEVTQDRLNPVGIHGQGGGGDFGSADGLGQVFQQGVAGVVGHPAKGFKAGYEHLHGYQST